MRFGYSGSGWSFQRSAFSIQPLSLLHSGTLSVQKPLHKSFSRRLFTSQSVIGRTPETKSLLPSLSEGKNEASFGERGGAPLSEDSVFPISDPLVPSRVAFAEPAMPYLLWVSFAVSGNECSRRRKVRQERVGRYRRISFIADLLASWLRKRF
jgi:hypothetical protein